MKDLLCDGFQATVDDCLIRHRSIMDVMTKVQEASARINRALSKSVTSCGCIKVSARRQTYPSEATLQELKQYVDTHVEGSLCEQCREVLEAEIGNSLFYLAALCNLLELNLYDVLLKEHKKLATLGIFNFS
ncbi:MAG TPA: DUF1573 domain-containing protein [Clostridia bacterium]|nr:DUF1573 domain-containing protein [Clostridia bacterium]